MKLLIHPAIDERRLALLREAAGEGMVVQAQSHAEALAEIADADGFFGKITPDLLGFAGRLTWVQSPTASLEHYLFPELIEHPCRLSNMRGLFSDVIADHVLGFMLTFARNLHLYRDRQRVRQWAPVGGEGGTPSLAAGPGEETEIDRRHRRLADCTLGVVGVGGIGAEVCRRGAACGMSVLGVDPLPRTVSGVDVDIWPMNRLNELLGRSDFVVIAAPHTPQTENMFRAAQFARMKPTACLINVGRGVIVNLDDLTAALQEGVIAGAALDVAQIEPLPPEHPLWGMENVLITPHMAAASTVVPQRHLETLLENVRRFARGDEPLNLVDKRAWF